MDRGMVVIPGGALGPHQPLLNYSALAGRDRGAQIHPVEWPAPPPSLDDELAAVRWVTDQIAAALTALPVARPVLVGKSLGTLAADLAADRDLPAIWHTPLLTVPLHVTALGRASAPYLLIGGTADKFWDGTVARRLTPHVLEIPGANHGLVLLGQPLARSAEVLGRVVTAVEDFLDGQVWPA